ncbi:MAG: universal stress protein [Verrucomicrobiales bacterium]|nr:universal stress protein [Verrucomicrobiales bacterium]
MKIKPTKDGNVVVELQSTDAPLLAQADRTPELGHIRRLLVPVDFSPNGRKAVTYASAFAKQFDADLTFLHVIQVNYAYGEFGAIDFTALEREMRGGAEKELKELVSAAVAEGVKAHSLVREGSPAKVIAEVATELRSDLLVVSTHGYTGLKHVLMGSIAEHVVRYAPCPVLVVRQQQNDFVPTPPTSA